MGLKPKGGLTGVSGIQGDSDGGSGSSTTLFNKAVSETITFTDARSQTKRRNAAVTETIVISEGEHIQQMRSNTDIFDAFWRLGASTLLQYKGGLANATDDGAGGYLLAADTGGFNALVPGDVIYLPNSASDFDLREYAIYQVDDDYNVRCTPAGGWGPPTVGYNWCAKVVPQNAGSNGIGIVAVRDIGSASGGNKWFVTDTVPLDYKDDGTPGGKGLQRNGNTGTLRHEAIAADTAFGCFAMVRGVDVVFSPQELSARRIFYNDTVVGGVDQFRAQFEDGPLVMVDGQEWNEPNTSFDWTSKYKLVLFRLNDGEFRFRMTGNPAIQLSPSTPYGGEIFELTRCIGESDFGEGGDALFYGAGFTTSVITDTLEETIGSNCQGLDGAYTGWDAN